MIRKRKRNVFVWAWKTRSGTEAVAKYHWILLTYVLISIFAKLVTLCPPFYVKTVILCKTSSYQQ